MSKHIPFELQEEIMKWLPVKSLLQFRSVSKTWKRLIDSSEFIAGHSLRTSQSHRLFVSYFDPDDNNETKYASVVDDDSFPHHKFAFTVSESVRPLMPLEIVGSSHGLFCLYDRFHKPRKDRIAVLWNPSIGKSIAIRVPDFVHGLYANILGFGVCPLTRDPMIILITQPSRLWNKKPKLQKVEVYTMSSRKWHQVSSSNLPSESITVTWSQVVVDSFIYWVVYDVVVIDGKSRTKYLIMSFDMTSERFRVTNFLLAMRDDIMVFICKLRESLGVLEYSENAQGGEVCGVWMMENESFRKMFTIRAPHMGMKTLAFRMSGEPIMERALDYKDNYSQTALVVYEPDSKRVNDVGIYGTRFSFIVSSYTETLLLLGC